VIASFHHFTLAASEPQYALQLTRHMGPPKQKGAHIVGHRKERRGEREPDPILKLRHALLEAIRVEEKEAAEKDGKQYAPKVSIWWEILDDKQGGDYVGVRFWDNYSFVKPFDSGDGYVIREGTRIGDLASFMAYEFEDGADYFEDDVDVVFEKLEGSRVVASLEPRKFKDEPATGTRTVSTTLMLASRAESDLEETEQQNESDLSEADEAQMQEALYSEDGEDAA
jgi:hypothetical protein